MLLQFAGVLKSAAGAGGKRFCWSAPQKKACTVLFVSGPWLVFWRRGDPRISSDGTVLLKSCDPSRPVLVGPDAPAESAGLDGRGCTPRGPITGASFAHSHSTFNRDQRPRLNTVPAEYVQLEATPTSYRPFSLQP